MYTARAEDKAKLKRDRSREAIALAMEGKWERAVPVNQEILRHFPEDVEALNRLGKAFLEMGRYNAARAAFAQASGIAPHNTIAKKNLERLSHLQETPPPLKTCRVVTPYLLVEESGKSVVTRLQKPAPRVVLAKMAAGDALNLKSVDHTLVVENSHDEYLGVVEPKLAMRLMRLTKGGNRYDAAIISVDRQDTSVIIWESYHHPDLVNVCSFLTRSREDYRVHLRDALLRYDIDGDSEEDEAEFSAEWKESYPEGVTSDGEDPSETAYRRNPQEPDQAEDEE